MEIIVKNIKLAVTFVALCTLALTGCQELDGDKDYGEDEIRVYIPQANVSNGLNNLYPVPAGGGKDTYNFKSTGNVLDIYMAVMRSGKISNSAAFTVNVITDDSLTDLEVNSGEISNAMALTKDLYTLPATVTVDAGKNSKTFFLSLNLAALMDGTYDGKKLILHVEIKNQTGSPYEVNVALNEVVVVIDVNALRDILYPESDES